MSVLFLCFILLLFSFRSQYRCPRRGGTWQRYSHQPPYGLASHRLLHEAIGHSYRCSLYPSLRRRRRRSDSSLPRLRAGRGKHGKLGWWPRCTPWSRDARGCRPAGCRRWPRHARQRGDDGGGLHVVQLFCQVLQEPVWRAAQGLRAAERPRARRGIARQSG